MRILLAIGCLFLFLVPTEGRLYAQPRITVLTTLNLEDPAIMEVDLRDVEAGERLRVDLHMINRSSSRLVIRDSDFGCSCVTGILPRDRVIPPNSSEILDLDFQLAGRSGPWDNTISLEFIGEGGTGYFSHWKFLFDLKPRVRIVDGEDKSVGVLSGQMEEGTVGSRFIARIEGFPENLPRNAKLSFLSPLEGESGGLYSVEILKDAWERDGFLEVSLTPMNSGPGVAGSPPVSNILFPVVIESPLLEAPIVRRIPLTLISGTTGVGAGWTTLKIDGWKGASRPSLYLLEPGKRVPIPVLRFSSQGKGFDSSSLRLSKDVVELVFLSREGNSLLYRSPIAQVSPPLLFVVDPEKGPYLPIVVPGNAGENGVVELVLPESVNLPFEFCPGTTIPSDLKDLTLQLYYPSNDNLRLTFPSDEKYEFMGVWSFRLQGKQLPSFRNVFAGTQGPVSFRLYGPGAPTVVDQRPVFPIDLSFDKYQLQSAMEGKMFRLCPEKAREAKEPE